MLEKRVKAAIIILIILMILVGVSGTVLYFTTDLLKSSEVLFQKYVAQNITNIADIIDISSEEQNIDLLSQNDYAKNTTATLSYLENTNDEEEIYNITEQGIIKNSANTSYINIKANYKQQELINIDLLEQKDTYGFRLSNLVQQFVSVENASVSYFLSSLGYEGQYFAETLNKVNISGLLVFSDEEIETLSNTYINLIFSDISSDHYSSNRNSVITLENGKSVTTNAYSLTLTKNEMDNIYKRIINQAISDEIILNKIRQIDSKIKEIGYTAPAGESIEDKYKAKLEEISQNLNYQGADTRKIIFTVHEVDGITVHTSIKTEEFEYSLELDNTTGTNLILKNETLTNEGTSTKTYSIGKADTENGSTRTASYTDSTQNIDININTVKQESQMEIGVNFNYTNSTITSLNVESNTNIIFGTTDTIPIEFDVGNNILLNDYTDDRISSILDSLKTRFIASLENSQSIINTKLLNNLIVMIDEREQRLAEEEQNNIELKKQRFNNKFILYEGQEVEYEDILKLLQIAGQNMTDYQVISGRQIRLLIEENVESRDKSNEIANAISENYEYDVSINYNDNGYTESIDIYVHQDE